MTQHEPLGLNNVSYVVAKHRSLDQVNSQFARGKITALIGPNGAGKSTLIKILSGVVRPDHGSIVFNNQQLNAGSVHHSETAGIAVIHQESTAFPDLNAIDNIFVGREIRKWNGCS